MLNERAKDIAPNIGTWVNYNRYERKVFFDIPEGITVKIPRRLAHILSFQDEIVLTRDSNLYEKRGVDLNHGVHALFIYVHVITHQIVGNAEGPKLRTVRMKSFTGGDRPEMDTVIFTQPHYVPISKQYVEGVYKWI